MIREKIVDEVKKILHGPIGGIGEELDKNPLDFYSVGVLFPQLEKTADFVDQVPDTIEKNVTDESEESDYDETPVKNDNTDRKRVAEESDESDISAELELTTKFRPSAAGISVLTNKNASLTLGVDFATYSKKQIDKTVGNVEESKTIKAIIYKHNLHSFEFLSKEGKFNFGNLTHKHDGIITYVELDDNAFLTVTTRPYLNDTFEIKTFTLINNIHAASFGKQRKTEDCIFQPVITLALEEGFQPFEDHTDLATLSNEDLNLKLLYRNYNTYALGHGISVNWDTNDGFVPKVFTQVLPEEKVNGVNLNPEIFKNSNILFIKRLSGSGINIDYEWAGIKNELVDFVRLYENWINFQDSLIKKESTKLDVGLFKKASENIVQCKKLSERMQKGIKILSHNQEARKAFEDANRAMFMQRVMADFSKHRRKENRIQQNDSNCDDALPEYHLIPFDASSGKIWKEGKLNIDPEYYENGGTLARWRPFQLAFLLSQIEGIIDPGSADRDTVDLIWFPTGGGKTEAYLGLTAFAIFYRRLNAKKTTGDPDKGAGVTVLMRYTLRLLNKQQFERACILICSSDLVRRSEPVNYGKIRISNGIWMGRSMTPNKEEDQRLDYQDYIHQINHRSQPSSFKNSPPLLSCPCCGNRLVRELNRDNQVVGRWGYFRAKNIKNAETGRFLIACTNTKCVFHVTTSTLNSNKDKLLPIYEVDETIYEERPSLLFSTVDKFVQLAWKSECFNLFNVGFINGQVSRLFPAPEIIIQDELHLISSALGTIYGVYEIVIDRLCREAGGHISKIVGATATVRNAEEQCKRLYCRSHFMQFPPPATDADDSFYAVKIKDNDPKNRLYIGFMPSGITSSTALIRLASVLLERIPTLSLPNEEVDNYYTLVVYFNALKELGKFRTFLTDDIVAYRKLLANHFNTFVKPFNNNSLCELSSVMTADDITNGLDRLEKTTLPGGVDINNILVKKLFEAGIRTSSNLKTAKGSLWKDVFLNKTFFDQIGLNFSGDAEKDYKSFTNEVNKFIKDQSDPVHIAPATNMISVGVDIPRLNTMIVNGQPKTTAEYIQASSRIGREVQGVVFTFLSPTKNRDRSHYEQFKAFHQAYYYYVESTSVTPFSGPALEKVLPTVLITLTRSLFLNGNSGVFAPDSSSYLKFIDQVTEEIKTRGIAIYGVRYKDEISDIVDLIKKDFFLRLRTLVGSRRLAAYKDFMSWDPITGRVVTSINNPLALYNAPAQFVESVLHDHIATMQTLRNVESSSKVSIKSY